MKFDLKMTLLLIALVAVATTGSAFLTSWVFTNRDEEVAQRPVGLVSAQGDKYDPALVWNAGEFTVNLASSTPVPMTRYLKTNLSFRASNKAAVNELEKRRVQIQDRVITVLRMTQAAELQQPNGEAALKQRLLDGVNELLASPNVRVQEVYLSELIIQ